VYDTPVPEQEAQNRKHGFFSKQWSRRSILLGLGFHFSLWWALSVWLSRANWNWTSAAWNALIAPVELGGFYLREPHVFPKEMGAIGFLVTVCLSGLTILSAVRRNQWIVRFNHLCDIMLSKQGGRQ
jgi:hypothetical protein